MKFALLTLAALASTTFAAPTISSGTCSLHCTNSHAFAYEAGKSYVYDYSVETSTALIGTFDDDAKLKFTAQAHIDVSSPCEYVLRLTDVNLEGSAHAGEFAEELTKHPLRFSFQDGMIENVCSDVSEPTWVLNIKRGVLSTFQNTMSYHGVEDLQEKDVSGVCNTHYKAVTEGNIVNVEKITDLASCSHRPDFSNVISSSSFQTDSPVQNLPLLKTTNECHQKLQDDILISAECEEIYESRPFQSREEGPKTIVRTALTLQSQEAIQGIPDFEFYRQLLIFDDEHLESPLVQIEKVQQLLNDLLTSSQDEIHRETPVLFSKLVEALKSLNYAQLSQVFSDASETHIHKFLVDAMPLVGTSDASALVRDMIISGEINSIEADIWFTSLAFQKHPETDMLNAIAPLLENNPSQKALLGTSALINNYCKIHPTCETEPVVQNIIQHFEKELGAGCRTVTEEEKLKVLVALKALGNAGHWVNAKSTLENCFREENDMEIRIAALDAWRHTPCEYDHSSILSLFQDESFDPELRIAAYLSLMSCPTPNLIDAVKERLISEGVNQVGSFIWTHMINMQESAAPEKQWVRELIGEDLLQKKFSSEALRFSRNYESSFFMNEINVGGSAESNIIFNSKSYLPRSAMLNLTLDLFGESINFFEIGGRIEGFEAYIERLFGSNGYFPEEHIEQTLRNMRSKSNAESTTLEGFLDKISDEPEGSYYLRVFGNELHYHHFHGMENLLMSSDHQSPMDFLLDLVKGNIDYTKSFQLLDSHKYIPTISGLPIDLETKITGTFGLKSHVDFSAESLTNFNIEGHVYPSVALEVYGGMLVDAHVAHTGVKMSSTLHTTTFLDGKVQVSDGKVIGITVNSPKDKIEILDIKGEYSYLVDDQEIKKEPVSKVEYERCTGEFLGMELCGSLEYTPMVFAAPFETDLYLKKTGTQTGYVFEFQWESDKVELLIDTPGSQDDHKVALTIVKGDNKFNANLQTPLKSAQGNLEYTWTNLNKQVKADVTLDSGEQYKFETGLLKTPGEVTTYEPSIVLLLPMGKVLNVHGTLNSKMDYYDTNLSTKMDVSYMWGSQQTLHFEVGVIKTLTDSMSTYSLHTVVDPSQFADFKSSLDMTFTEVEHQHYKAEAKGVFLGETYQMEGKLDDNSLRGKFNVIAEGSIVSPVLEVKANIGMYADSEKASADLKTTVNGQNYDLKFEGTKSSVLVEANIIRHILLNANIATSDDLQKLKIVGEWNKDVDPTAMFLIEGQISQEEVKAHIKVLEREATVSGKLLGSGVELEGNWDDKKVSALVQYTLGETKSLSVSVETPFQGMEKQDATFSITLKENEINSRIVATWKNSQQVSLTVVGQLQPGMVTNAFHTEVVFSSTFSKFERISFKLDHEMQGASIKTDMIGLWDNSEVKTVFQNIPNNDGVQTSLSFESPFSEKTLVTLNHVLNNKDLTSTLEVSYGANVSTAVLKGHFDLSESHDVTLTLKINIPSPNVPEINANLNYKFDLTQLTLVFEGIVGEKKVMFNAHGELSSGESTKLTGDLRLITPFMYPITATVLHTRDNHSFESKFELTRFWADYGNLKCHTKGHMNSPEDIVFSADIATPLNKAAVSLNHKVTDTNMISSLDYHFNDESINILVNGLLDRSNNLANLEAEITSTLNGLDDVKVTLESMKNNEERVSKVLITKNEQTVTIDHIISVSDFLNWENTFAINGHYKLKNIQKHTGTLYTHDLEYTWNSETVILHSSIDNKSDASSHNIDVLLSLLTPWTEIIKFEVHHVDDGTEYKPIVSLEYMPGRKIELKNTIKFGEVFHCESVLTTPFTEPLGYEITLDYSSRKAASLMLMWGPRNITFKLSGMLQQGKMEGSLDITSTYLDTPVAAEISYDIASPEKRVHLVINYIKKLEITGLLSGNLNKGDWSLVVDTPLEVLSHIELNGSWIYELTHAQIQLNSTVSSFEPTSLFVKYDTEKEKKIETKLTYGSNEVDIVGKLEAETILIDITTPFAGWEHLKLSLFASETAIDSFVSKNDQTIKVKGTMHVKLEKGTIDLSIETPFATYETIAAELSYSLRGPVKQIHFKSSFGAGKIILDGTIDLSKDLSPIMKLEITTPFAVVSKIGGEAHWDLQNTLKTVEVKGYRNDRQYHWHLEVSSDDFSKGYAKSNIVTPFPGWTSVTLEGDFDIRKMPYIFKFVVDKEGAVNTLEGNFNMESNAINAHLTTPVPGWESADFSGNFNWEDNHFTGNFELANSADKYQLTADVILNTQTPKLHVTLVTPISYITKVDFNFNSNLVETEKNLNVDLNVNDVLYSLHVTGQVIYKTGYINILGSSPVPGFSSIDIQAKYDFVSDVKTAEVDFKIEDDSKHFSIKTDVQNNKFHIELHTPFEGFELLKMIGDYTAEHGKHTVLASFEKDHQKYDYNADVTLTDYSLSLAFSTPIEAMKNVAVSIEYELFKNGLEGLLHFEINGEKYEIKTRGVFTPLKSELLIDITTPVKDWKRLALDGRYDVLSEMKGASLFVKKGSFEKKITIVGKYTRESGSIKLEIPIDGFEVLGAAYTLNLDLTNHKLDASLKVNKNSQEWNFAAHGEYSSSKIMIKFQTPFEAFNIVAFEGDVDFNQKLGHINAEFGSYKFTVQVSYAVNDMLLQITTPFDYLKVFSLGLTYKWTSSEKNATLNVTYNDKSYVVSGILNLSPRTSEITFQATSPFPGFNNFNVMIKYDIDDKEELISSKMTSDQYEYSFKLGVGTEGTEAHLNWDFTSTFPEWSHAQFLSNVNWAPDQQNIEISLGKEDNLKVMTLSGRLTGLSEGSLKIHTPFRGMEDMGGQFLFVAGEKLEGKLDLVMPFYLVPKIHVDVNINLSGKINGVAHLDLAGELYTIKTNLVGSSFEEGYSGDVEIYTPIHALSKVILNGNIIIKSWTSLQTHFKADLPQCTYEMDLNGDFSLGDSSFLLSLDTMIMNVHRKITLEAKYPSFDNLEGKLVLALDDQTHSLEGKFSVSPDHVVTTVIIESTLIGGKRQVSVDLTFPESSYDHISLKTTLIAAASHSLNLDIVMSNRVEFTIEMDSPEVPKFTAALKVSVARASFSLETPKGVHKIDVTWRMTYKMPADYVVTIEVASPLLADTYAINVLLNGDKSSMIFKAEYMIGGMRNVIEGSTSMSDSSADVSLNIEIPLISYFKKATLAASLKFAEKVEMHITATYIDNVNTFDLVYDKSARSFHVEISSPYIPTGMARGEGQIAGEMMKDMQIKMSLQNNDNNISGTMNVKVASPDNMRTNLIITTPFKGYKKMKFGAQYMKSEETKVLFFIDKPIKFNTELRLRFTEKEVKALIKVETPIEDFQKIEGEMRIPLNVFAPKISADVMVGGVYYGGHLTLRNKAPYEVGVAFIAADRYKENFHLRTDSSFFSIFV